MVSGTTANGVIRPRKLAHIVLRTPHIVPMRDWYVAVLSAQIAHETQSQPKLCFLTYDDEHHRIAMVEESNVAVASSGTRGALEHVAFTYASLADLMFTYRRLANAGIEPFWPIHHGATLSLYYKDPDGNRVELQVDAMTLTEATSYVESVEFATNPIGVIFDPATLADRLDAGEDLADLLRRPPMPKGLTPLDMLRP